MLVKIFDIKKSFEIDPNTLDLKTINQSDAVNQSLDLAFTLPYRIGVGYTNSLIEYVFSDISYKTEIEIQRDITEEFERNFKFLEINFIKVTSFPNQRKINVVIEWEVSRYGLTGTYDRIFKVQNQGQIDEF